MNETEITRQLTILMKYKNPEIQKLRDQVVLTLIGTNAAIGGAVIGVML